MSKAVMQVIRITDGMSAALQNIDRLIMRLFPRRDQELMLKGRLAVRVRRTESKSKLT
jgi:hypothetical protein